MLNMTVIGAGAAGNKAVAELIAAGYPAENCAMINSTNKDVPEEYKQKTILFGTNRMGGCGKERSIGKKMLLEDLSQGQLDLDSYVPTNNAHAVVIVGSCEGGSGSASIPILAKYYKEVYELPVILVLFFGFKDDVRGIQNTIEIVQELSEDYTIIGIDNNKFMSSVNNNRFKAEKAANKKFIEIMKILIGGTIIPGEQVIDDTDLFKIVTTPGYMVADGVKLPQRIKTMDDFNSAIYSAINNHYFVDPPKNAGAKRIGLIFNVNSIEDTIDYRAPQLNDLYGNPYELFISMGLTNIDNEFYYIVSGMKLPIDEINSMYNEYLERSKNINKSKDSFFENVSGLRGDIEDSQFNMLGTKSTDRNVGRNKKNFFADFGIKEFVSDGKIRQTGAVNSTDEKDY